MDWVRTLEAASVAQCGMAAADVAGRAVALYCVGGEFYATDDLCTHGHARLSEGYLEDFLIECPLHQGMFDIRTGAAVSAPCSVPVQSYPVKVEQGYLHVGIE